MLTRNPLVQNRRPRPSVTGPWPHQRPIALSTLLHHNSQLYAWRNGILPERRLRQSNGSGCLGQGDRENSHRGSWHPDPSEYLRTARITFHERFARGATERARYRTPPRNLALQLMVVGVTYQATQQGASPAVRDNRQGLRLVLFLWSAMPFVRVYRCVKDTLRYYLHKSHWQTPAQCYSCLNCIGGFLTSHRGETNLAEQPGDIPVLVPRGNTCPT